MDVKVGASNGQPHRVGFGLGRDEAGVAGGRHVSELAMLVPGLDAGLGLLGHVALAGAVATLLALRGAEAVSESNEVEEPLAAFAPLEEHQGLPVLPNLPVAVLADILVLPGNDHGSS
eukprot:scaffold986_cov237-Pinguiococcus_pyrenoidosus.AAC.21